MKAKIEIKRNEDGLLATGYEEENEFCYFWWSEGNGSCDCHRRYLFCKFLDLEYSEDYLCSDGLFSVRITDRDTLEILLDEF